MLKKQIVCLSMCALGVMLFAQVALAQDASAWLGGWKGEDAELKVDSGDAKGFKFTLDAFSGANVGTIEGKAQIVSGSVAQYKDADTGCAVKFTVQGEVMQITTDGCEGMGGMGVVFDGTFKRTSKPAPAKAAAPVAASASKWQGVWKTEYAEINISSEDAKGFKFTLDAFNGANVGAIEGKALIVSAGVAGYKDADAGCLVKFSLKGDSLVIETSGCDSMGGMGVVFDGTFKRAGKDSEEKASEEAAVKSGALVEAGVLQNAEQEQTLIKLAGEAGYKLIVETFGLVSDGEDLDKLNTTVKTGGIRGLFTICEAIVMASGEGKLYCAVINDGKVDYYTNDKAYCGKLPKTIQDWKKRFDELPVTCKVCGAKVGAAAASGK